MEAFTIIWKEYILLTVLFQYISYRFFRADPLAYNKRKWNTLAETLYANAVGEIGRILKTGHGNNQKFTISISK